MPKLNNVRNTYLATYHVNILISMFIMTCEIPTLYTRKLKFLKVFIIYLFLVNYSVFEHDYQSFSCHQHTLIMPHMLPKRIQEISFFFVHSYLCYFLSDSFIKIISCINVSLFVWTSKNSVSFDRIKVLIFSVF